MNRGKGRVHLVEHYLARGFLFCNFLLRKIDDSKILMVTSCNSIKKIKPSLFPLITHKETKICWEPFLVNKDLLHNIFFSNRSLYFNRHQSKAQKKILWKTFSFPELDILSKQSTHLYKPGSIEPDQEGREEEEQLPGFREEVRKLLN